jgi:predicted nucleic acid-binding protein
VGPLKTERIVAGSRVLLDTVALIYFLEHHPVHYQSARELFQRVEEGDLEGVASTLVLTELLVPAYRAGQPERATAVRHLLEAFPHLSLMPISASIASTAARVRAEHKLTTPDAIHAATATVAGASWIATNDSAFGRLKEAGMTVWLFDQAN